MIQVTPLYAGLGALLLLVLAVRVSIVRRGTQIGIGDGGNSRLARRIRVHANALENLLVGLLLLLVLELNGLGPLWLHVFGIALIVGRVLHAWGLSSTAGVSFGRFTGILLNWLAIAVMAVLAILRFVGWRVF